MTATTAGGGGGGVETRRNVARRDGDIACVGPAERRHWFHRGETRDGRWDLGWSGSLLHTRSRELQLSRRRTEAENATDGKR